MNSIIFLVGLISLLLIYVIKFVQGAKRQNLGLINMYLCNKLVGKLLALVSGEDTESRKFCEIIYNVKSFFDIENVLSIRKTGEAIDLSKNYIISEILEDDIKYLDCFNKNNRDRNLQEEVADHIVNNYGSILHKISISSHVIDQIRWGDDTMLLHILDISQTEKNLIVFVYPQTRKLDNYETELLSNHIRSIINLSYISLQKRSTEPKLLSA